MVDLKRGPTASDNRPYFAQNMFPPGHFAQFVGKGDDITNGIEESGNLFALSSSSVETASVDIRFLEKYYLIGGAASWGGAVAGDWVDMRLKGPATSGTSNPGGGVYDKYALGGGANMFIPNATQTGDWDLNLSEKYNENVDFTKVVPIPAASKNGFFNFDSDTGVVSLNTAQTGSYNLFDFEVTLHAFVRKVPLVGVSQLGFTVPSVKPYLIIPQWKMVLSLNNSTSKDLELSAMFYRGITP